MSDREKIGLGLGEEVDLARFQQQIGPGEERAVELAPVKEPDTPGEWIRQNLFSSWFNAALTLVSGAFVIFALYQIFKFVFVSGEWAVIRASMRAYMVGGFPEEELWRVWTSLYGVALLGGLSWGITRVQMRWSVRRIVVAAGAAAFLVMIVQYSVRTTYSRLLVAGVVGVVVAATVLGRIVGPRLRRPLLIAWLLAFPAIILALRGFDGVPPHLWEGFLFNMIAATVGIFASFPIGIALALGRRSRLPGIKVVCVAFIELFRGVPLVAWLIFSKFVLDLLLPPGWDLPDIIKAFVVMTLFSAAYVAEIVRGGLQGVHFGQFEAARALALPTTRMMGLIILPQALRSTIPAMISHFISLFKDTALFSAIEVTDLLEAARRSSNPQGPFGGTDLETLIFAGFVFWMVAFSMSRWSQRLEVRLGVGER
ncbi:MAG: amino acid ABC transporter permease [Actinomycetota bacterium]